MCRFRSDRDVVVCDVAIGHVRGEVDSAFPDGITYGVAKGGGTLVIAAPEVAADDFEQAVRRGMRLTESLGQ